MLIIIITSLSDTFPNGESHITLSSFRELDTQGIVDFPPFFHKGDKNPSKHSI